MKEGDAKRPVVFGSEGTDGFRVPREMFGMMISRYGCTGIRQPTEDIPDFN